jgi:hypothetical protein
MHNKANVEQHNAHFGDEALIESLQKLGRLEEKVSGQKDLSDVEIEEARNRIKGDNKGNIPKI